MKARISVTELSRELQTILDRVHRRGDSLVVERDGEALASLEPVGGEATWSTLAAALRGAPRPDEEYAADLEEVQRNQPDAPTEVWPS